MNSTTQHKRFQSQPARFLPSLYYEWARRVMISNRVERKGELRRGGSKESENEKEKTWEKKGN